MHFVRLLCCGCLLLLLWSTSGCLKEFSYEGGPLRDTVAVVDTFNTLPVPDWVAVDSVATPPVEDGTAGCEACEYATSLVVGAWNFRADSAFFCGTVSNAVLSPDKDAFTFFGPSTCNPLTGIIITAYFDAETFTTNRAGLQSSRVTISYYNRNGGRDVFRSGSGAPFSITINEYEHRTGIAIGRFSGTALRTNNTLATLEAGNFKIQF